MDVEIVTFPETKVAVIEHRGPPALEHDTARKLIAWKIEQRFVDPAKYRSYGIHYTEPRTTRPSEHRVDFCLSRLPRRGESVGDFPTFFHYVNVGPNVKEEEMITDVYLPLK